MKAIIVSLNYNPGHFSHLIATYKMLEELKYRPYLYLNKDFDTMDVKKKYRKLYNFSELHKYKVDLAFFWFPSLKNISTVIKLKLFHRSKIVFVLHEPFDSIIKYYQGGFSVLHIFKIWMINLVNVFVLYFSDKIILPSKKSHDLYIKKYLWINKNQELIPLLFDDENTHISKDDKEYFSYIGTVASDHAFDKFVDFMFYCIDKNLLLEIKFLIATRSGISNTIKDRISNHPNKDRVLLQEGRDLSTDEINFFFQKSIIVWNAYDRTNQSGVLPKAYMFGCAVLASATNINDFVENKVTGVEVDNDDIDDILNAIKYIIDNKDDFFNCTRNKFLNTFYYRSQIDKFRFLIED